MGRVRDVVESGRGANIGVPTCTIGDLELAVATAAEANEGAGAVAKAVAVGVANNGGLSMLYCCSPWPAMRR